MWKVLLGLLKGGNGGKSPAGNLAWEIREAIKGKELDPNELIQLQTKINEVEAGHRSVFVAGWRPFIGWVCGFALAYNFIIRDLFIWALKPEDVSSSSSYGAFNDCAFRYARTRWLKDLRED